MPKTISDKEWKWWKEFLRALSRREIFVEFQELADDYGLSEGRILEPVYRRGRNIEEV